MGNTKTPFWVWITRPLHRPHPETPPPPHSKTQASLLPAHETKFNFYRASSVSTVLAVIGCLTVRPSVRHKSELYKMAKPRITPRTAYDSPETLVFRCQKSRRNSNDITPNGGAKWRWGRFESGDLYHRKTLPLRRSTAATLCSSAMIDANDAFTVAERYRPYMLSTTSGGSRLRLLFISTHSVRARFRLH